MIALFCAAPGMAQAQGACQTRSQGLTLLGLAARVEHPDAGEMENWELGARVEWSARNRYLARASYRHEQMSGAALNVGSIGAAARLRVPAQPCVALDAFLSLASGLNRSDQYRNFTMPLALIFDGRVPLGDALLVPFVGVEAILSGTNARLLTFPLSKFAVGVGARAGATVQSGRFLTELSVRGSSLPASIGPQPLGRLRIDLGIGVRL